jgi:subtilisin family serine protease
MRTSQVHLDTSVPAIGARVFWNDRQTVSRLPYTGIGQSVAVLDTGIVGHPFFYGLTVVPKVFLDNGKKDSGFNDSAVTLDFEGHGTRSPVSLLAGTSFTRESLQDWALCTV